MSKKMFEMWIQGKENPKAFHLQKPYSNKIYFLSPQKKRKE